MFYINFKENIKYTITENVDKYNIEDKTINPKYIYEKIKEHIKPIGDIKPEFDDTKLTIKYSWLNLPNKNITANKKGKISLV
jgi:hypothetical protein